MSPFYGPKQVALQETFDSRRLAERFEQTIVRTALSPKDRQFLSSCDLFFLSTIDHEGWPTVSYKGGLPGFVKVLDDEHLAFPSFNGNGMHLSTGNIAANGKVGLLFIDFENPRRLRVHGTATVSDEDELLDDYEQAELIVRVEIKNIFPNCSRYIHRYDRREQSEYVPTSGRETPRAPWKRQESLQDVLPAADLIAEEE